MSYWDASALTKLYFQEADCADFLRLAAGSPDRPRTARHGLLELERVAWFKAADGQCTLAERDAALAKITAEVNRGDLRVLEWDGAMNDEFAEVLRVCYEQNSPITVRTADAMHLAAARQAGETEVVSTDVRQRAAALACGLTVFPPP